MPPHEHQIETRLIFYALALATLALYWTGLTGPFVLDDPFNLQPLQQWLDGNASAMELIFGNSSGELGRPVSMATLWVSAATGGMHPFPFKLGNLLIHIVCGLVGWRLLRRLLAEDPQIAKHADIVALVLAGFWLIHPINVSTVLYAVQRMAQLGALFTLASLLAYVQARRLLADGHLRKGSVLLFGAFPVLLVLGLFSKENAAVAPALCLVVELAYFWKAPTSRRVLQLFYGAFLVVPVIAALGFMAISPERLFGFYATRDFGMLERLLSQPRALLEYIGLLLWPRGGQMGVFVDDFIHSTGLLSPPATLVSIAALAGVSALLIFFRRQAPSAFAGWFIFLVAHGVESTILPLELYFEHRNYLPGFGILLASAGILGWLAARIRNRAILPRAALVISGVIAIVLATITWQQVQVWRSMDTLVFQALEHRPTSLRARLESATLAAHRGDWNSTVTVMDSLAGSKNARESLIGAVGSVTIDCLRGAGGDPTDLERVTSLDVGMVTLPDAQVFGTLSKALRENRCGPDITEGLVADTIVQLLDGTDGQPVTSKPKWLLRTAATELYMRADRWHDAQVQGELAWQPRHADPAVGALLARIHIRNGNKHAATRVLAETRKRVSPHEVLGNRELKSLGQRIDEMAD